MNSDSTATERVASAERDDELFKRKVTCLSFSMAVMVLYIHAYNIPVSASSDPTGAGTRFFEFIVSQGVASAAVPLFFFVSAFLFYRNYSSSEALRKYKSRARSLFVPYLLWNTAYMLIYYVLARLSLVNRAPFRLTLVNILKGVLLYEYNGVFWFMFSLVLFVIVSPIIYLVMRKRTSATICLALAAALSLQGAECRYFKVSSLLYYLIGAYYALNAQRLITQVTKRRGLIGALITVGVLLLVAIDKLFCANDLMIKPVTQVPLIVVLSAGVFLAFDLIVPRAVHTWMNWYFPIYCMQELVLETTQRQFSAVAHDPFWCIVDYIVSPVVTVVVILFAVSVMVRRFPCAYSIAFGNRHARVNNGTVV